MRRLGGFLVLSFLAVTACGPELGERTITVPLTYSGDSNAGAMDATGTATVDTVTGKVDITVAKLPTEMGTALEGWLAGGGETAVSTGIFKSDMNGDGTSSITLGNISLNTYTKVVITVEPDPDMDPDPDSRHSIQGEIPEI